MPVRLEAGSSGEVASQRTIAEIKDRESRSEEDALSEARAQHWESCSQELLAKTPGRGKSSFSHTAGPILRNEGVTGHL